MQSYALENVPAWALEDMSALGRGFLFSGSQAQDADGSEKLVVFSALVAEKGSSKELV